MGNITSELARTRLVAEVSSRIGTRLDAQRVEIYRFVDGTAAHLVARWSPGVPPRSTAGAPRLPLVWFPWSLGNIRPEEYVFIRNAGALPVSPSDDRTIADLGMSSVVMMPVVNRPGNPVGAVCAYWSDERSSWDVSSREPVCSLVRDAWSSLR